MSASVGISLALCFLAAFSFERLPTFPSAESRPPDAPANSAPPPAKAPPSVPDPRPGTPPLQPFAWSAKRPLRWSDFRGAIPTPDPGHAAFTECTVKIRTSSKITTSSRGALWSATATFERATAEALFEPSRSYVRRGAENAALLAHEQIHFDLGHLQALKAVERITGELGSKSFTASGTSEKGAFDAAQAKIDREVDRISEEERAALAKLNEQYDHETAHGSKPQEQKRWSDRVERQLRDRGIALPKRPDASRKSSP